MSSPSQALTRSRIVLQSSAVTPLGAIKLAGFIENSRGAEQGAGRRLGQYALVYSLRGSCDYWDEHNGRRTVRPGEAFFLFPEIAHRYGAKDDAGWDEFFIVFEGPLFDLWRTQGLIAPERTFLTLQPVDHWLRRWESCLETRGLVGRDAALRQVTALQATVVDALAAGSGTGKGKATPEWIELACAALNAEGAQALRLPRLARSLGVSFETFRKRFTEVVGMSPGAYRSARLVDEAGSLLATGRLTGKEIAARLGFADEYHFSRRFKALSGMTPTAFRQRVQGGNG